MVFTHGANETITSSGHKTAPRGRIPSHYEFGANLLNFNEGLSCHMTYASPRFVLAMRRPDTVLNLCLIQAV